MTCLLHLFILTSLSILTWTNFLYAADKPEVRLAVKAEIRSSVHLEWEKLPATDQRYISFSSKSEPSGLKNDETAILLPYGLLVKLRTNDPQKIVKIHVKDLKTSEGSRKISSDKLFVSIDGAPGISLGEDVLLRGAEGSSELQELVLLFRLRTTLGERAGRYSANFSFITSDVP